MRVLITGGHFSPALAVIQHLKKRGAEVAVAGRRHPFEGDLSESYEFEVVKREKIKFFEIKAGRFQRKFTTYSLFSLLKTPGGYLQAIKILREFKPDVVLTFGGYIGLPISYAAKTLGIPVILHEQTQRLGLAASLISKIASKILITFESSAKFFPNQKVIITGNPIRDNVFKIEEKIILPQGLKVIYITGGSTGSHFINILIGKIVKDLVEKYVVIHQTGENKFEDFEKLNEIRDSLPSNLAKNYILKKFISEKEVGYVFSISDLIISRSGINTVLEILATGKVGLFIPLKSGQQNEQLDNAKLVKEVGIGDYIEEERADPELIKTKINDMIDNKENYLKNIMEAKNVVKMGAAEKIVDIIYHNYG